MTNLLAIKIRRDLRASWPRYMLMVIAIAVSLTVFGGVLYAWSAMGRETRKAYLGTEPASATVVFEEAIGTQEMATIAEAVRRRPGIIEAAGRTQFTGDVEVNGGLIDIPVQVFVAAGDDPLRIARFDAESGEWPPSPDEIFLGRDSLSLLGVAVGDTITLESPKGIPLSLRIADTVYDPSLSPSPQEQTARAYLSTASLGQAGAGALLDQLKMQVADPGRRTPTRDRDVVVRVAGNVGEWLQSEFGVAVREIQVPEPFAHPHQWQADALLLSLLAGGAAALVLSTILVANMLNSLFTQQIPQIGIMKAIGARSAAIARLYVLMTLVVSAAATLLALIPAILIGRALLNQVFGFLGIEVTSLAAPWWAYGVIFIAGLGLPPLMALRPVIKTSKTTVRAAIDHHGGGETLGLATGLFARLSRIRHLDRGLLLALRNTVRRPMRFLLAVGLMASAGTVFVAGMSLGSGTEAISEESKERRNWDVDIQLAHPVSMEEVVDVLEGLPNVERVEGFNIAPAGLAGPGKIPVTRTYPDQGHGRVSVTAIPAKSTTFVVPNILEGRWLKAGDTGAVVLNQIAWKNTVPDIDVGETVQLLVGGTPSTWRVVGLAEEREGGSSIYVTAGGLADALGRPLQVNQLRVVSDDRSERARRNVADLVEGALTDERIEVSSAASVGRREAISEGHLGPITTIVLAIAVAMGVIGGIGLGSTMSANVLDRVREFGIMHAIGARPKAVRRTVVAEGILLAVASCVVAILPALGLTAVLGAGLGNLFFSAPLPYRISILAVGIWVVLAILGAALATDAAATRASRITVREALAYL